MSRLATFLVLAITDVYMSSTGSTSTCEQERPLSDVPGSLYARGDDLSGRSVRGCRLGWNRSRDEPGRDFDTRDASGRRPVRGL